MSGGAQRVTCHPHLLMRRSTADLGSNVWYCDDPTGECRKVLNSLNARGVQIENVLWMCATPGCDFILCSACVSTYLCENATEWIAGTWRRTLLHPHLLGRYESRGGRWRCDAPARCLNGLSTVAAGVAAAAASVTLRAGLNRWRCVRGCDYDLCEDCLAHRGHPQPPFQTSDQRPRESSDVLVPTSHHPHPLRRTFGDDLWVCHTPLGRKCPSGRTEAAAAAAASFSMPLEARVVRWTCSVGCNYALCGTCMELLRGQLVGEEIQVAPHEHPLRRYVDASLRWNCDAAGTRRCLSRLTPGSAASRSGVPRWRCTRGCDYDLCQACVDACRNSSSSSSSSSSSRSSRSFSSSHAAESSCEHAAAEVQEVDEGQRLKRKISQDVAEGECPEEFCCPITQALMKDPVILPTSGESFERTAISEWVRDKGTDPTTRLRCKVSDLIPNRKLRFAIERWKKQKVEEEMTARTTAAAAKESEHPQISSSSSSSSSSASTTSVVADVLDDSPNNAPATSEAIPSPSPS